MAAYESDSSSSSHNTNNDNTEGNYIMSVASQQALMLSGIISSESLVPESKEAELTPTKVSSLLQEQELQLKSGGPLQQLYKYRSQYFYNKDKENTSTLRGILKNSKLPARNDLTEKEEFPEPADSGIVGKDDEINYSKQLWNPNPYRSAYMTESKESETKKLLLPHLKNSPFIDQSHSQLKMLRNNQRNAQFEDRQKSGEMSNANSRQASMSYLLEEDSLPPVPYNGFKVSSLVAHRILTAHGIQWKSPFDSDVMNPLEQEMVSGTEHLPISRFLQNIPPPIPRSIKQLSTITKKSRLPWRYDF